MKISRITGLLAGFLLVASFAQARVLTAELTTSSKKGNDGVAAGCAPPSEKTELDVNNVRALIQTGGDMWWDLVGQARYEVPEGSGRNSLFAGSLWLGGQDVSGQLKVAAQRFRSGGNDFWTGPLSTVDAEINAATCLEYDKHFVTTRNDVAQFVAWYNCQQDPACDLATEFPEYQVPQSILDWPAHGRDFEPYNEDYNLAPFIDRDGDNFYDPIGAGDYPAYDLFGTFDCTKRLPTVYGDKNLWWVFNDKGNIHTESGANSIGMEIRAQAFGFSTNDEVNNMTFYNYELVNRSTFILTETYMGSWVDPDLGNAQDDFVGCDVERGLGYCFNGDEVDEDNGGAVGYGSQPPAIGVDFFQGPFQDNDGKDNCLCDDFNSALADDGILYDGSGIGYGDDLPDNERLGMRAFLYHNNDDSPRGDPRTGVEYYNYLRSRWRDNQRMVYGGTGRQASVTPPYIEADFMFPGDSDPLGWGTGGDIQPIWTEVTAGNQPFDRRFIQSAGPFTLAPGAVNFITVGVVWAQASTGGAQASVTAVRKADDKTQALFDACFVLIDGPDAPDIAVTELDKEIILQMNNVTTSNNFNEGYVQQDPFIVVPDTIITDDGDVYFEIPGDAESIRQYDSASAEYKTYRFQGYQVFQLKDASVSGADLNDIDKARLLFQCDIKDGVTDLINYTFDSDLGVVIPEAQVTNANNAGIFKSIQVTQDLFAEGDNALVNYQTYYYMAIAYAYNNFKTYDQLDPEALDGQTTPYLPSRKGATGPIRVASAVPHAPSVNGTRLNSSYGQSIQITRHEGLGNGTNDLEIAQESVDAIMAGAPWSAEEVTFQSGRAPITVKVIDPLNVKSGDYTLSFIDTSDVFDQTDATWMMTGDGIDTLYSSGTIAIGAEQIVPSLGISVMVRRTEDVGTPGTENLGLISSTIEFNDLEKPWLSGIADSDGNDYDNWIRSGTACEAGNQDFCDFDLIDGSTNSIIIDEDEVFETVADGTWAPFRMIGYATHGLVTDQVLGSNLWANGLMQSANAYAETPEYQLNFLHNVNIYFTSDQSKWTRSVVLEMQDDPSLAEGNAIKWRPRAQASVNKDGTPAETPAPSTNPEDANYISGTGMGWFPGYAIDLETGERLNIAFGEDSYLISENGNDMMWNPTETITEGLNPASGVRFGGKHYIYVFRNNLAEEGYHTSTGLENPSDVNRQMPGYDAGAFIYEKLSNPIVPDFNYIDVFRAGMWAGLPLLASGQELLSTDAVVKLRVEQDFKSWSNSRVSYNVGDNLNAGSKYWVKRGPVEFDGKTYKHGQYIEAQVTGELLATANTGDDLTDNVVLAQNGGLSRFGFSLEGLEPDFNVAEIQDDALGEINIVPNPYYAYSEYETDKVDYQVRIINLPERCDIRIYTLDGNLIRTYSKADAGVTSITWDLKNEARIPIASGVYLIHVNVPGVGERVLKWFGVLRPIELDSF